MTLSWMAKVSEYLRGYFFFEELWAKLRRTRYTLFMHVFIPMCMCFLSQCQGNVVLKFYCYNRLTYGLYLSSINILKYVQGVSQTTPAFLLRIKWAVFTGSFQSTYHIVHRFIVFCLISDLLEWHHRSQSYEENTKNWLYEWIFTLNWT